MTAPFARRMLIAVTAVIGAGAAWLAIASPSLIANYRPGQAYFESSAFFPRVGLWLCAISAAIVIGQAFAGRALQPNDEVDAETSRIPPALASFLIFVLYALALSVIGYTAATAAFGFAIGALISLTGRQCLIAAASAGLVGHLVFVRLIHISFPSPLLPGWLGLG